MASPAMGAAAAPGVQYASWGKRLVAAIIDCVLVGIVNQIINVVLIMMLGRIMGSLIGICVGLALSIGYFAYMESSEKQATVGKNVMGILVTDMNGARLSMGKAILRYIAKFASTLILFIGWFMPLFTDKKQALHDMIAGTLVVEGKR